jgi:hypothetical protein
VVATNTHAILVLQLCLLILIFTVFFPANFSSRPDHQHSSAHIDINLPHHRRHYDAEVDINLPHRRQYETEIDLTERQYRSRFQPSYREEVRVNETTVDPPHFQPTQREEVRVTGQTVDPPRFQQDKMGYYDEDGKLFHTSLAHPLS